MAAGAVGCDDDGIEPSVLDEPRLLAIATTPRALTAGEVMTAEALVHDLDPLTWSACPTPWFPIDGVLSCPTQAIELGTGNPISAPVPEGISALWLRVDGPPGSPMVPSIKEVRASSSPAANPAVTGVFTTGGQPVPATVKAGSELELRAQVDPAGQGIVTSWFTTGGKFDFWRTFDGAASTLQVPDELGQVTLIVVARDSAGGVGWTTVEVEVTP